MEQVFAVLKVENGWSNYCINEIVKTTITDNNIRWKKDDVNTSTTTNNNYG